ncbi:MAG: hypothetical protein R3F14_04335 [Polyangiaceae bacterium]
MRTPVPKSVMRQLVMRPICPDSAAAATATPMVGSASQSARFSISRWSDIGFAPVPSRMRTMRAAVVLSPVRSTRTITWPSTTTVAARTRDPARFSAGSGSPVSAFSSTIATPSTTTPSAAMRAPASTTMRSPGASSVAATRSGTAPRSTHASDASSVSTSEIAARARSVVCARM